MAIAVVTAEQDLAALEQADEVGLQIQLGVRAQVVAFPEMLTMTLWRLALAIPIVMTSSHLDHLRRTRFYPL